MNTTVLYDVIIIGGSYAGLSAALTLGRSLRTTLIIDGGQPCNRQTPKAHNLLTHDGTPPADILKQARKQIGQYPTVESIAARAIQGKQLESGFVVQVDDGRKYRAKKLIFATGIRDILPQIDGLSACWGISAIHCPYCHGYEFRNQVTGILASGDKAAHLLGLVGNLSKEICLFQVQNQVFEHSSIKQIAGADFKFIGANLIEILHKNGYMQGVRLDNNTEMPLQALYIDVPFEQHSKIPMEMGCVMDDTGLIQVDASQKTSIPGVYACGDNASAMRSLSSALYTGNLSGAMVNMELSMD